MSYPYRRWRIAARTIFDQYDVPLRRSYPVWQLVTNANLRNAIRDTYFVMWRWFYRNQLENVDSLAESEDDLILFATEFIGAFRAYVQELADEEQWMEEVLVDPGGANIIDTSRIANLDRVLAGLDQHWEYVDG